MRNITIIKIFNEFNIPNIEAKTTAKQYIQAMLSDVPLETKEIKTALKEKYGLAVTIDTVRGRLHELKKDGKADSAKGKYMFQTLWTKRKETPI